MIEEKLTDKESKLVGSLSSELLRFQQKNAVKWSYHDGEIGIKNIGIAIPANMINVESVVGWPGIAVSSLAERINWLGWAGTDGSELEGLENVFETTSIRTEFNKAKQDSLVTGVGFLAVTAGDTDAGEPSVIINAVSPQHATYVWDSRANRVGAAMELSVGAEGQKITTLYFPDSTVTKTVDPDGKPVVKRFEHDRGRASLVAFENRRRTGATAGQSEITKPIRYLTDNGVRTMLGMEYNREIYTTPQRYFENVEPEQLGFEETDDPWTVVNKGYKVAMTRSVILPPTEDGEAPPRAGQFESSPPTPYIDQMEMLSKMVSAEAALPPNYLGFTTQNPPSADSIRALESRLIKKAEDRCDTFGQTLKNDVAHIVQSILLGARAPVDFTAGVDVLWRDPATPTQAAATDAAMKLASANIVPPDSDVLLEMVGFTPRQIRQIRQDRRRSTATRLLDSARERQAVSAPVDASAADWLAARGTAPGARERSAGDR